MPKEPSIVPRLLAGWLGMPCVTCGLLLVSGIEVSGNTLTLVMLGPIGPVLWPVGDLAHFVALLCWFLNPMILQKKKWFYAFFVSWITVGFFMTHVLALITS